MSLYLISALAFLRAVTGYELDAPLYEFWYKERGLVEFELKAEELVLPTARDIEKMSNGKQQAWLSLIRNARLWLKGKPSVEEYVKALPNLKP